MKKILISGITAVVIVASVMIFNGCRKDTVSQEKQPKDTYTVKEAPTFIITDGQPHIWGRHWCNHYNGYVATQIRKY